MAFVNEHLVPVWVDTRVQPYPRLAALDEVRRDLDFDADGRVGGITPRWYHVRSAVISPDAARLLNPEEACAALPTVRPGPYLAMLRRALARPVPQPGPAD